MKWVISIAVFAMILSSAQSMGGPGGKGEKEPKGKITKEAKGRTSIESGEIVIDVWPKGCAFSIRKLITDENGVTNKSKPLIFDTDNVKEVGENEEERGKKGKAGKIHAFSGFKNRKCIVTSSDCAIPNSIGDVKATCINATMTTSDEADSPFLTTMIYIPQEDGEMQLGDETFNITKEKIKFAIYVENWVGCCSTPDQECTCDDGDTKYIDLRQTVRIPGTGGPKAKNSGKKGKRKDFDVGDNAEISLSKKVKLGEDGAWTDMEGDFPKLEQRGSNTDLLIRCPASTDGATCIYDPEVTPSDVVGGDEFIDLYDDSFGDETNAANIHKLYLGCLCLAFYIVFFVL